MSDGCASGVLQMGGNQQVSLIIEVPLSLHNLSAQGTPGKIDCSVLQKLVDANGKMPHGTFPKYDSHGSFRLCS